MTAVDASGASRSIPDRLFQIFVATLSPEKTRRQSAEEALGQIADQDPHFALHLLEVASQSPSVCEHAFRSTPAATANTLLAAAIRFRNEVGRSDWNRNPNCPETVKTRVRDMVVPLQCQPHVSEGIRRQLLSATVAIIEVDYPTRWPHLLPQLTGLIEQSMTALRGLYDIDTTTTQEIDDDIIVLMLAQLKGSLGVLRGCCKVYEDPLKVEADDADAFAAQLAPSLVSLMELLSGRWQRELSVLKDRGTAATNSGASMANPFRFSPELEGLTHCMRLTLKCLFSLFTSRWPACLCETAVLDYFYVTCVVGPMQSFEQVILPLCAARLDAALHHPGDTGLPAGQLRGDHFDAFHESPTFMLLKWVMNVAYKLTQEFASPKGCERRCRAVAKHFAAHYLQPTVEAALSLVRWHAMPMLALTSKAYILALEVLTVAVDHKDVYMSVLHPHAEELMTVLLFPRLAFTAADEELWNDNPEEYVRKQSNPAGDVYSAKVVSTSLLLSFAVGTKRFHDKTLVSALVNFLLNQLQAYVAAAAQATGEDEDLCSPPMEAARRVDAALYCLYHFKKVLLAMRFGDDKLEWVLSTFAVPVIQYPLGFLRARAVLVLSTFAPTMEWSSQAAYQQALQPVLGLLNDVEAPVRVQACVCFSRLVCHPHARDLINPCIAELIQHYFNVMRMMDNEAVVRTLRRTIAFYKYTLSQWALELTDMLVSHFAVVLGRVTTKYHALEAMTTSVPSGVSGKEEDETFLDNDGFADVLMAADELLETLTTLVKALPESAATTTARHAAVMAAHAVDPQVSATPSPLPADAVPLPHGDLFTAEMLQQDMFVQIQTRVAPMLFVILGHQGGSTYGFMDPALSLLTTLIARSPCIAPPMWKVLWCLAQLIIRGGAVDYIQQLLPPVDNFVSVDPAKFLHGTLTELAGEPLPSSVPPAEAAATPAQLVLEMCAAVLASTSLREREVSAVPKMYDALVQNAWAACCTASPTVSAAAPALVSTVAQQALTIAGTRPRLSYTFRVLLANNVFSCLVANVTSTVAVLHALQATRAFWSQFVLLLSQPVTIEGGEVEDCVLALLRDHDRRLFVYATVACLRALAENLVGEATSELQAGLLGVVECGVLEQLAEADVVAHTAELRVHQRRIAKIRGEPVPAATDAGDYGEEEEEEEEEEWDSGGESEDGDWLNNGEDEEEEEEEDRHEGGGDADVGLERALGGDSRLQGMVRQAQRLRQQHGGEGGLDADGFEDDGGMGDNLLEEEEDFSSPLDGVNAWAALAREVERTESGSGAAAGVMAQLRSAACQSQANAVVRARDVMVELFAARQTHAALLSASKCHH